MKLILLPTQACQAMQASLSSQKMVNPYRNLHGELLEMTTPRYQNLSRSSVVGSCPDEDHQETQSDGGS